MKLRLLALPWSRPGHCSHLGIEPVDGKSLCLSLNSSALQINEYLKKNNRNFPSTPAPCRAHPYGPRGPGRAPPLWAPGPHLVWKFCTLTLRYGAVLRWHHRSKPSLAEVSGRGRGRSISWARAWVPYLPTPLVQCSPSTEMSWMAKRRMMVQIMPRVILRFPSTISVRRGEPETRRLSSAARPLPLPCFSLPIPRPAPRNVHGYSRTQQPLLGARCCAATHVRFAYGSAQKCLACVQGAPPTPSLPTWDPLLLHLQPQ